MNTTPPETEMNVVEDEEFMLERLSHFKLMEEVEHHDQFFMLGVAVVVLIVAMLLLASFSSDMLLGIVMLVLFGCGAFFVTSNASNIYTLIALVCGHARFKDRHHFCPNCKTHLPSTLKWRCSCCKAKNGEDNEHSYFGSCKKCGSYPDSLLCPECTVIIQLSNDPPETMATVVSRE
jgi:hypothetical protein